MVVHARQALLEGQVVPGVAVEVDERGTITEVRPARDADPPAAAGLLVPGLVNAHLHLELSWAHQRVPGGEGLVPWVAALRSLQGPSDADADTVATAAAQALYDSGTALVSDVSNRGHTAGMLAAAGLAGVVQHELLGMHQAVHAARLAQAEAADVSWTGPVATRPSPHATYSTPGPLIRAASRPLGGVPASIHVGEDPGEATFTTVGEGPFADLLDRLGLDWSWFAPAGDTPVQWLASLGVLGPDLLLVHGVHVTAADVAAMAQAGGWLCLCPRSNLHIGGQLPVVAQLREGGVGLCLGTDSLGSSPDLDVLGEVACLIDAFPEVPPVAWLHAATAEGAAALGTAGQGYGKIAVGTAPGLLLLEGVDNAEALVEVPPRRWVVPPNPTQRDTRS